MDASYFKNLINDQMSMKEKEATMQSHLNHVVRSLMIKNSRIVSDVMKQVNQNNSAEQNADSESSYQSKESENNISISNDSKDNSPHRSNRAQRNTEVEFRHNHKSKPASGVKAGKPP